MEVPLTYLDTNVAVWLSSALPDRISPAARLRIQTDDLMISPMVLLELEYLYESGRSLMPASAISVKLQYEAGVQVCEIGFPEIIAMAAAEKWTRDPFDRIIVAHAKANGLAYLISADEKIRANYPRTIW